MTIRLENEARIWRKKGYPHVADEIERVRKLARADGAPEVFVEADQVELTLQNIVNGLYLEDNPTEQMLTDELIEHFNSRVGGRLPDETRLWDLPLPEFRSAKKYGINPEDLSKINPRIRRSYSMCVRAAGRGFVTVGSLRSSSFLEIQHRTSLLGDEGANFLYNAFRPLPQPSENQ